MAQGMTNLKPGTWISIKNIGDRFSGKYFVTTTRHVYGSEHKGGYQTHFQVTGKQPPVLMGLLAHRTPDGEPGSPMGGNIVVGIVTDNVDPDGQGRVKVKYPWLSDNHTSHWARCVSPMAGKDRGFYFLPEVNDEVLVAFEHGAITRPYLLGSLWNGKDSAVEKNSAAVNSEGVNKRTIKTRIGHTVLLDDTAGKGGVTITTKDGRVLAISDADQKITMKDKAGNSVVLNTADNSIKAKCMGDFAVDATGKVMIEGKQGVTITSPLQTEVKGTAGVTVQSTAIVEVKGSLVKLN